MRAHGLELLDPDLEMFTLGGGGAHCLGQAVRRERRRGSDRRPLPAAARSTPPACSRTCASSTVGRAGPDGARRVCWTRTWRDARDFLGELVAEIGLEPERDAAGNLWVSLDGEREPALVVGSHVDSVPTGVGSTARSA